MPMARARPPADYAMPPMLYYFRLLLIARGAIIAIILSEHADA